MSHDPNRETEEQYDQRIFNEEMNGAVAEGIVADLAEGLALAEELEELDGHDRNVGLCTECGAYLRRGEIASGLCVECEYGGEEYAP